VAPRSSLVDQQAVQCSYQVVKARVLNYLECDFTTELSTDGAKTLQMEETCLGHTSRSHIDSSVSNSTPSIRTQIEGLITLRLAVTVLLFGERHRSSDVEPNQSSSVLSASNWSLFAAHQSATSATVAWQSQ